MSILAMKNFMALEKGRDFKDTMILVFLSGQNLSRVQWKEKYKFIIKWTREVVVAYADQQRNFIHEEDAAAWKSYRSFAALLSCLSVRATTICNGQLPTTPTKSSAEMLTNEIVILRQDKTAKNLK